ncbi:TetR/AcrR family transcriptional regulator C-terminal domain-containing protein [Mycolicibacterium sp. YH-1]|uniref:TetR/AcrR family transcriptional regulator C-terminal domain-containing protein n=1 Tax=Mycolicibacterium sp. YH-1 TaxID=2908837 RepID=UPI001F4C11A9|nr:TetR/AcrR family transcriptional regulator C-terminal domain-containing protein [Mycolicibacterium sp. YH-1]UNB50958.1 TetR/AcrR family transcriptional regulator C-terminal domain-containing protein [Mycolicibacterium sp. YH-1]
MADDDPGSDTEVRSVWLRRRRTARGEQPLTLPRIVEAAVDLLDDEGIDRLTMRRLAERLQAGAPSLYWHVDTKDDVIDLAVDAIFGTASPAGAGGGRSWRDEVTEVLTGWRAALLRHPWAAALPARQRPTIGPNFLAGMEALQAALTRAGFEGRGLSAATWVLYNHVMGSAASQSALRISPEERRVGQEQLLAQRDRYPTLAGNGYLYDDDFDGSYRTGLDYLLDGLEAQLDR